MGALWCTIQDKQGEKMQVNMLQKARRRAKRNLVWVSNPDATFAMCCLEGELSLFR